MLKEICQQKMVIISVKKFTPLEVGTLPMILIKHVECGSPRNLLLGVITMDKEDLEKLLIR